MSAEDDLRREMAQLVARLRGAGYGEHYYRRHAEPFIAAARAYAEATNGGTK